MKKLLMILGVVFLVAVVLGVGGIGYAIWRGSALDKESKLYADDAISSIAGDWSVTQLEQRESPELKAAVVDAQWDKIFAKLKKLGSLKAYHGATGQSLMRMMNGQSTITAVYTAQAEFENARAQIEISLIKHGDNWEIIRFSVSSPQFMDAL